MRRPALVSTTARRARQRDTDDGEDEIALTLWDIRRAGPRQPATRLLLFSSNWTGNATVQQQIAGGNLVVHAR